MCVGIRKMRYHFATLCDETEITYMDMAIDGTVKVYVETPDDEGGFCNAICVLPKNKWKDIVRYSDEKLEFLREFVECNTPMILEVARKESGTKCLLNEIYLSKKGENK